MPRLRVHHDVETSVYARSLAAEVHFVCVGTPQRPGENAANLRYVHSSFEELAKHLHGPTLVVGKSTVPVGTAARLNEMLRSKAPAGQDVTLAWKPEFLREGFAVRDTLHPDRLVYGLEAGVRGERARGELVAVRRVIDGRNKLDVDRWTAAGWTLRALGRPTATAR